jgi:hypothetical protein
LLYDGSPKIEPLPAPRTSRSLLLQKGQLMCPGLTVLSAQTLNLLIPDDVAHQNEMMSPVVTE